MTGRWRRAFRRSRRSPSRHSWWRRHWLLIVAAVFAVVVAGSAYVLLRTDLVDVRAVQVSGTAEVAPSAVRAAAQVPRGTPLFRVDAAVVRARVLTTLPSIEAVSVQRLWPSTVRLVVRERQVAAAVPQGGGYLLVDRNAVPYRAVRVVPAGVPVLAVSAPGPTDPATVAAVAVLRSLPADLKSLVVSAAAPTEDQVTLNLRGGRRVLWGDASDNSAKAAATRVLLRQKGRLIDVTAPGLVTVR